VLPLEVEIHANMARNLDERYIVVHAVILAVQLPLLLFTGVAF